MKLTVLFMLVFVAVSVQAAEWPNAGLESDVDRDGAPDFWRRVGSRPAIAQWSAEPPQGGNRVLSLIDADRAGYGSWQSGRVDIVGGTAYRLGCRLRYDTDGTMRFSIVFFNTARERIKNDQILFSAGKQDWKQWNRIITVPDDATALSLQLISGGSPEVTGSVWLDDITLVEGEGPVPYIGFFPHLPDPLILRDWQQTARDYHRLAFNPDATGPFLPLLKEYEERTKAGYCGPAFSLPSYVNKPAGNGGEALAVLGAVLGGSLAGLDMTDLNGVDRVAQCEKYCSKAGGRDLVVNGVNSPGSASAWYHLFPSMLFFQIASRYPDHDLFRNRLESVADSWLDALAVLDGNWERKGFDFRTMHPVDGRWVEPDMAAGIAWLEYMAYIRSGKEKYLAAADSCMASLDHRIRNPLYEVLEYYGPALAARMNAELGRDYDTDRHLNWIFSAGSDARRGWGCIGTRFGAYDAYGLMGATRNSEGYAFAMNSFVAAGAVAPLARYEPRHARCIGRWLLHVAANGNLFYPDALPAAMQDNAEWVAESGVNGISYEGVRNRGRNSPATSPHATGGQEAPVLQLNPYGAWSSAFMAALFETSNVPGMLWIDCVATETFPPDSWPTHLLYNPHRRMRQVELDAGPVPLHLYDAVAGRFLKTGVSGRITLRLAADSAVVLVQVPAGAAVSSSGRKLLADGIIIDYWHGARDSDGNGCPDWLDSLGTRPMRNGGG